MKGTPLDIALPKHYFALTKLLNGDTDGNLKEEVALDIYYNTDSKDIPEKLLPEYTKQKSLALQIEEIYNKAKNDTYTKEALLRFGRFEFEVLEEQIILTDESTPEEITLFEQDKKIEAPKFVLKQFYLFSLPVKVDKEISEGVDRYSIAPVDFEIRLNLAPIYEIFRSYKKEELVYEFLNEYVKLENDGKFNIPIAEDSTAFIDLWHALKAKLKLTDASFNEESFTLDDLRLTLSPRSNFFLVEDLTKLSRENEKTLEGSSLSSWFSEEGLNLEGETCEEKTLYFPFPYDNYQRATTSLLGNKASIIQGPPGTGKSETISNIISHLAVQGNKVLFVSQKAQALRVVKDKLKTLEAPLSFGYVPSVKLDTSLDDEADTITSQLSSLDTYINSASARKTSPNIELFTDSVQEDLSKMDALINLERVVFELDENRKKYNFLSNLPAIDEDKFLSSFTDEIYDSYNNHQNKIEDNNSLITRLKSSATHFKIDGELFTENLCSSLIEKVIGDVKKTGFDRSLAVGRYLNNIFRKVRLNSTFSPLPKEVYAEIDEILRKDNSRHLAVKDLEKLLDFCRYWEAVRENIKLENQLREIETNLNITKESFAELSSFLRKYKLNVSGLISALSDRKDLTTKIADITDKLRATKSEVTSKQALTRKEIVAQYLRNRITDNIKNSISKVNILRKLREIEKAFKKSKRAFKTFDNLKSDPTNFQTILNIVPVWIMDLDDASRLTPLVSNLFDYVIFDEASQCNIAYTIPAMYRAKKAVFVGDPEQMRDTTVMFKSNQSFDQLANRYKVPEALQIKPTGNAVQSVLDIAKTRFGIPRILQYHYRSPMELIGFSNKYFYAPKGKRLIALNNKYLTYKDTDEIMVIHEVKYNFAGDMSDRTNMTEAMKALELYKEMSTDPKYEGKSFAILTFFNDQAELIRKVFETNKIKESEKLKIAIIEGIQGDEKDIIIYSFVIRDPEQKRQYVPLTGESGNIQADINAGRVNVAFSRARLQVHCLVSMPIEKMPSGIWIKRYLEFVRENGRVSATDMKLKKFDSYFEEEFYSLLKKKLGKNYSIQNQVESCGFKLDFVVTNKTNGHQLAIECDGPTHFKDHIDESYGIYVENDIQRQRVLESAGWKFYRVGYSEWIENDDNKDKLVSAVKQLV